MLTFTDVAREKVSEFLQQNGEDAVGLRLTAYKQGRTRFRYDFSMVQGDDVYDEDKVVDLGDFKVYVDPQSADWLQGTKVDFITGAAGTGFKIDNPQAEVHWDDPLSQKVQKVIDEQIAPSLASHGGWIELVEVKDETAFIEFGGGCQGCGMSQVTLKQGIEGAITAAVPEIKEVVDNTDHSAGATPYCSS